MQRYLALLVDGVSVVVAVVVDLNIVKLDDSNPMTPLINGLLFSALQALFFLADHEVSRCSASPTSEQPTIEIERELTRYVSSRLV